MDEWEQREDARSLARAEQIKSDPNRLKAAVDMGALMAEESKKETEGLEGLSIYPSMEE